MYLRAASSVAISVFLTPPYAIAGLLVKGLAEVQGAEALLEGAGAAGTARAIPSRRAPSRNSQ